MFSHKEKENTSIPLPKKNAKGGFLAACTVLAIVYFAFSFAFNAHADPPTSDYYPGETLAPNCSPTSTFCTVLPPLFASTTLPVGSVLFVGNASGTITASTSSLYLNAASNTLSVNGGGGSGGLAVGTTTFINQSLFDIATSSNILTVLNNGNVGIGTTTPAADLTIQAGGGNSPFLVASSTGATLAYIDTSGDFLLSPIGSTTGTPKIFGFSPSFTAGQAGQLQFGDVNNILQNGYGDRMQLSAYWGVEIHGNTEAAAPAFLTGQATDPALSVFGTTGNSAPVLQLFNNAGTSTFMTILGSGAATFGTSTNPTNSIFAIATSSNILTVLNTGNVGIGTSTPAAKLQVAGAAALGVPTSTEGQLLFYDSTNGNITTIQPSTSTAASLTFTLPSSTGASGQSLITDGTGHLSWGSTGFTVIASSTTNKVLVTTMASDTLATIHPSNGSSSIWITANVIASTTAATSSVGIGVFKALNCTTQVGTTVTSTFDRAGSAPAAYNITLNVVDAPGTTTAQTYYLCADYATGVANLPYGELTLQEIRAGSDIAESYNAATDTPLTAGDVVSLDPSMQDGVQPSQSAYDSTLVGVVSTQPGAVLGNATPQGSQVLVALAGRVPVQVTNANGNISIGDELTSSDIPGVAMRATEPGRVVGVAMENFAPDPSAGTTTGSILVFVNPGWSLGSLTNPTDIASSSWSLENASSSGPQFVLDQFTAYVQAALAKLGVAIQNGIVTLQQLIANKVTTNVLCVQGTCVTGDELQNLLNKNGVGNSDTTSSASGGGSDTTIASSSPDNGSSTTPSGNVSSTPDTDSSNADSTTDISSDSTVPPSSGGGSDATSVTNPPADDSASTPTSAPAPASSDGSSDSSGTSVDSGT